MKQELTEDELSIVSNLIFNEITTIGRTRDEWVRDGEPESSWPVVKTDELLRKLAVAWLKLSGKTVPDDPDHKWVGRVLNSCG